MRLSCVLLLASVAFPALAETADAYVRVSPRDRRYLELTDGTPYIPVGLNMISPPYTKNGEEASLAGLDDWLTKLSSNGGNYIRVWLSNPFWAWSTRRAASTTKAARGASTSYWRCASATASA